MKKLLAVLTFALVSACATTPDSAPSKVFAAHQAYEVALTAAVTYKKLPPCEAPAAPKVCSDKSVVATLQKADNVAFEALKSAQNVVRSSGQSDTSLQTAVRWAQEAVGAFARVANSLNVK